MASSKNDGLFRQARQLCSAARQETSGNLQWLQQQMHPYFSITMQDEAAAVATLAQQLPFLLDNRRMILADRERRMILACLSQPGSLYATLRHLRERDISYAQLTRSYQPLPGSDRCLEVQRFEYDRKSNEEINDPHGSRPPEQIRHAVQTALKKSYPHFVFSELDQLLTVLWRNNRHYVSISPARRIAQILWLYQRSNQSGGVCFDVELTEEEATHEQEYRVMFAAGNPPQKDFLQQTMEIFNRLGLGVKRTYCLMISNGIHPYFLGTFYIPKQRIDQRPEGTSIFNALRQELYNTQILSTASQTYLQCVTAGLMTGEEASLLNAFISFCHTNLAHNQPDRFAYEEVQRAFLTHPDITRQLLDLFRLRFSPDLERCNETWQQSSAAIHKVIADYNTGHHYLDETRRTIFNCARLLIEHTLKCNFFVAEKHALAFRLDPVYLEQLGETFTADLPAERPFRVTFFFGRHGAGYHIGFSDIARGGWRTILSKGWDEYITGSNTLFREVFVLAHTQHLKNKDIYEGGSKMAVILDAADMDNPDLVTRRLYKLQYGFLNAFLDIFVTDQRGQASHPRVVDYYGEDEPIELGPDENMHDSMVELIAAQSLHRNYLLGIGLISSKKVGINHKEFGVTSTGVITFAEIAMQHLGIDMHRDRFSVKLTGGPGGDVAGNALRLLLERSPGVEIRLIVDGSGALFDPAGADHRALKNIVLAHDLDQFEPNALSPGGFILYRNQRRTDGLRQLYKRVEQTAEGLRTDWVTVDEFHLEFGRLLFEVQADLFIPAGGRPETVNSNNWRNFLDANGTPSARVIVEGANSFITPDARDRLQEHNVIIMRDASANKCGVISSSYEIIGNLLFSEKEFLANKNAYVADVLDILQRRAADEARLILQRRQLPDNTLSYTDISAEISQQINARYAELFDFFRQHPEQAQQQQYRRVILSHMPKLVRETPRYRQRIKQLPEKYRWAILASEIASSMIYRGNRETEFEAMLQGHLEQNFPGSERKYGYADKLAAI